MPRLPSLLSGVCLALTAVATLPAAEPAKDPALLQATDLLRLRQIESPALSPDGKWLAYVVRSIEPRPGAKDDWVYETHLWLAATDASVAPRQLTHSAPANSSPVWNPAGDRIAFVRTLEKEKPQVYVLTLGAGEAQPVTKIDSGAGGPRWSPDGTKLLFTSSLSYAQAREGLEKAGTDATPRWKSEKPGRKANDAGNWSYKAPEGDKKKEAPLPKADPDGSLQERREWLAKNEADGNPRPLDRLNFLSESDINPEQSFSHVFVQEAREGAEAKDLTPGYTSYLAPEWMSDGLGIVCTGPRNPEEHPDRGESTNLLLIDAKAGGAKKFCELVGYSLGNALPSPDGKLVALTATPGEFLGYGQSVVATVPVTGGEPNLLTGKLDRGAVGLKWTRDSRAVYFIAATNGDFPLYRVDVKDARTLKVGSGGYRDFDLGKDRQVEVLTRASDPYEVWTGSIQDGVEAGKSQTVLTQHNSSWLKGKKLSAYEPHTLVAKEGLSIEFWTMKPTNFEAGKKYPLLLEIHGGPQAMWGPGEDSMWFEFQYFAARGFAIVFANPHGSGGYGYDFQHANYRDWGIGPSSDILSAVDFAAKEDYVNRAREVVTGGSYGGYMTAWIVGHDHRFKAAVAQRGVYELSTFFGEANAWRLVPRAFGGYPWEPDARHILDRDSPLTYVQDITTPLLIQHGDNDRRTGFVQSEMLFKSLKVLGRDVEEVRYPRATHELSRSGEPRQRLDTLVRYEEFFRRYIGEN